MIDKNIVAIIQARMGSTRLPGKVLLKIQGKPILWHIVNRLKFSRSINKIVISTSTSRSDDKIELFAKGNNIDFFRGSENDVLDRVYKTALKFSADTILRITGDCPCVDPFLIDNLIKMFETQKYDYVAIATGAGAINIKENKFPDGLDAEYFSFETLKNTWENAKSPIDREHVTPYMWKVKGRFRNGTLYSKNDYSNIRLTLDHKEDLNLIKKIYNALYEKDRCFNLKDIIKLIESNPILVEMNKKFIGKEKYEEIWNN
jgi:spore coat polysaccharide biosynthesis protein SpsF (cytidylyltransferase family)